MRVLGIETSCDETGIAIYDDLQGLLAHVLHTQVAVHAPFGGVVPELASRDHVCKIMPLIAEVMQAANTTVADIDGIAYTKGPGLVGALLVGATVGRTLAYAWDKPAVGVHHLEGHLLASFLEVDAPRFPFLALLVSGGHTELVKVSAFGHYEIIGDTLDDAVGEAFDKTAKLLGLAYPGGAKLAAMAQGGVAGRYRFPRPMVDRPGLDFSFSGLKTFAMQTIQAAKPLTEQTKQDIAYAFEEAVVETLAIKCKRALQLTGYKQLVVAGGVGANLALRKTLTELCHKQNASIHFPRHEFCTDNGAMIAYAGYLRLAAGEREELAVTVFPRWPLTDLNVTRP